MRTIIAGPVTDEMLETARLFGIEATSYVTNGLSTPPFSMVPTDVFPVDPKLPGPVGVHARDWTLGLNADAIIMKGYDAHLLQVAAEYNLTIYQEE